MKWSIYVMAASLVAAVVLLGGFAYAETAAPYGACTDIYNPASMHSGSSTGDNHPHAPTLGGTNYQSVCGGAAATPTPAYRQTPVPTPIPTPKPMACRSTCPEGFTQTIYPGCYCVEKPKTCTNTCGAGDTQQPYPDCSCITTPRCTNYCPVGWTRTDYPGCSCKAPAVARECTNTCPSGQTRKPFPDCRCVMAAMPTPVPTGAIGCNYLPGVTGFGVISPGDNHARAQQTNGTGYSNQGCAPLGK